MSIAIFIAYEPLAQRYFSAVLLETSNGMVKLNPVWILLVYSFFAFMLTWIREIIKDMEDFKGDAEDGCITMPIKIGLQKTIRFIRILTTVTLIPILTAVIYLFVHSWWILGSYALLALAFPMMYLGMRIGKSLSQKHFAQYSKYLKIVMLSGIFTLILYYIIQ